jgi:hypothetical protein
MTPEELEVFDLVTKAFNKFSKLEVMHRSDREEFALYTHILQRQIMCRDARRNHPDIFINLNGSIMKEGELIPEHKEGYGMTDKVVDAMAEATKSKPGDLDDNYDKLMEHMWNRAGEISRGGIAFADFPSIKEEDMLKFVQEYTDE